MSSNTKILFSFLILIGFLFVVLFFAYDNKKIEIVLGGKTFNMEVVDTFITREKGLSGHKPLLDNEGMVFIFQTPDKYGFWMKDMLFPLDIIWIDQNFKIIHIEKFLLPSTYPKVFSPDSPAIYVLEVSAGQADRLNLKPGDGVEFLKK